MRYLSFFILAISLLAQTQQYPAASGGGGGSVNTVAGTSPITASGSTNVTIGIGVPVNPQTGTTYTMNTSDLGKLVTFSNAGSVAVTLPQCTSSGFPDTWYSYLENRGVGTVTVTPTTSTIDGAASLAITTNQGFIVSCRGTDTNYYTTRGIGSSNTGTVTSFSSGSLSPLFTASVATATTTPALSFSLSNAAQNTFLGGLSSGGTGAPTYRAIVDADLPATAVTPGTYGDSSHVGQFTVNSDGRITAASNVSVTGGATAPTVITLGSISGSNTLTATSNVATEWTATLTGAITFTAASITTGQDVYLNLTTNSTGFYAVTYPAGMTGIDMSKVGPSLTVNQHWVYNGSTYDYQSGAIVTAGAPSIYDTIAAPTYTVQGGSLICWPDSTQNVMACKDASGNVTTMARGDTTTITLVNGVISVNTGVIMSRANAQNNPDKYLLDAGSSGTTYTVCPSVNTPVAGLAITGYQDGMDFTFVPHTSSSGTVTINVCAQGPVPAYMLSGSSLVAVTGTAPTNLIAGVDYKIVYNSVTPSFEVTPMNSAGGSGTVTTTGSPASPNLAAFSGPTSITNASADTVSGALQCADVSGSGTAQSCNTAVTFNPSKGDMIIYTTTTANTGALTVTVNSGSGGTASGVYKWGGSAAVVSGDITANKPFKLIYDAAGHWDTDDIGNAPSGGGITCTSCVNTQVAFATGASTITTDAGLTYTHPATNKNLLTIINGSADTQGDAVLAFNANGGGTLLSMMNIAGVGALSFGGSFTATVPTIYSSAGSILNIQGGLATPIQTFMQGTQIWTDVNPTNKFEVNAQGSTQSGVPARAIQASSDMIYQYSSTTASGGTADLGWARNAAGVLEVDNGTAGTYRDLKVRHIGGGTTPTLGTCGTSPSLGTGASDFAGTINVGSGVTTSCTLNFGTAFANAPACVESDNSTAVTGDISAISTSSVTFSFSASLGSGQIYYICAGL